MKKVLTILVALIVLVLITLGVVRWLVQPPQPEPPTPEPPTATQPEWCPDVEVIAAPGTWESSATDDPVHPAANPTSFMLTLTQPLQERFSPDDVQVWTVPYTAQFRNIHAMHELSYDQSRNEGSAKAEEEMRATHGECPLTDFILVGFSQGAVFLGDIASVIGTGSADIVPAERIRGVALVADGRREAQYGQHVGNPVSGVGAEVALRPVNALIQPIVPEATMRGTRPGGFGTLNDRTVEICAPDDHICDAPLNVLNALERAEALIAANGIHAQYATNPNVIPGTTTSSWLVDWATDLINK